mmetsp:Transcript_58935/g.140678  ORF Transcript_58935/g.140678 Transcript_58935/m.140678 type:complete len:818 (+) Transcript_58935:107-2560(+)
MADFCVASSYSSEINQLESLFQKQQSALTDMLDSRIERLERLVQAQTSLVSKSLQSLQTMAPHPGMMRPVGSVESGEPQPSEISVQAAGYNIRHQDSLPTNTHDEMMWGAYDRVPDIVVVTEEPAAATAGLPVQQTMPLPGSSYDAARLSHLSHNQSILVDLSTAVKSANVILREAWDQAPVAQASSKRGAVSPGGGAASRNRASGKSSRSGRKTSITHNSQEDAEDEAEEQTSLHPEASLCEHVWHVLIYDTMLRPSSPLQFTWEILAIGIVLYDMFELPMQVFEPPKTNFTLAMRWIAQLFWNVDLLVSFRTGYINGDKIVMEPRSVAVNYLQTWFSFDILIVGCDWLLYIIESTEGYVLFAKAGKTLKVFRAARTMKMLRLMKMRKAFHTLEDHIVHVVSGCQTPIWGIAKFLLAVVFICHFLCSGWYFIGVSGGSEGWVKRYAVEELGFWERYLVTFHWCLTQFGAGNSNYVAETSGEYLCNIGVLLVGLLVAALLVSSVTNTFSIIQQQNADQFHQMWMLRRFCMEHDFPRALSKRIAKHVERHIRSREESLEMGDVKMLSMLSKPLHADVVFHIYLRPLCSHPFLRLLCRDDPYTMRHVATTALQELIIAENDVVFTQGAVAKMAYNVLSGTMAYRLDIGSEADFVKDEMVRCPQWISEQVFWFEWVHCGDLDAKSASRCIALDAHGFCTEIRKHSDTFAVAQLYAQARLEEMAEMNAGAVSDVVRIDRNLGFMRLESSELVIPELARRMNQLEKGTPLERLWRWLRLSMLVRKFRPKSANNNGNLASASTLNLKQENTKELPAVHELQAV